MRILVADDEPVGRELVRKVITARTRHEVVVVEDGATALALTLAEPAFDVLLLDWMMPGLTGPEVCRRVRAATLAAQPYVALVTAKNMREEVIEGLSAGADDFLTKPLAPDLLLARLAAVARRPSLQKSGNATVMNALRAASEQGDGELVIKSGELSARVFIHEGKVAWAHLSDKPDAILDLVQSEAAIRPEEIREVLEECRRTGARLTDTLVAFGLMDRASLRVSLLRWTQRQLEVMSNFPNPQTLFLPKKRHYSEELLFELEELLPEGAPPRRSVAPLSHEASSEGGSAFALDTSTQDPALLPLVERCMRGEGVIGAAVINRQTGCCLASRGRSLNPDVVWAHIHALNVVARHEQIEDTVIVTSRQFHLVRLLEPGGDLFAYVVVESRGVLLAMARVAAHSAVEQSMSEARSAAGGS